MGALDPAALAALAALGPAALWLIAVAFFSPLVISIIQQSGWSERRQSVVAFAFYVAVAAVTAWLNGIFTTVGIVVAILVVFVTASAAYKNLWKPTGISPAIEAATSPKPEDTPRHAAGSQPVNISINTTADPTSVADQLTRRIDGLP